MRRTSIRLTAVAGIVVAVGATALGGCAMQLDQIDAVPRTGSIGASTIQRMQSLNMDRAAPVLIRIYKQDSVLEVWKQDRSGTFGLLASYPICRFSGTLGPKVVEGDGQAPEGFYEVTPGQMNPQSHEYLAFNIGFPNAFDRSLGRTGSFLMVHGGCRSVGCYAMTDGAMSEIYALVSEAFDGGQQRVQLQAFPFRMTTRNLIEHARSSDIGFWTMLKTGSDMFEATRRPPGVSVCDRRYVFRAADEGPLTVSETDGDCTAPTRTQPRWLSASHGDDPIARLIDGDFRVSH